MDAHDDVVQLAHLGLQYGQAGDVQEGRARLEEINKFIIRIQHTCSGVRCHGQWLVQACPYCVLPLHGAVLGEGKRGHIAIACART
jgi:hypothetical protein